MDSYRVANPEEKLFSYWFQKYRVRENNVGWRIDYILVSRALKVKKRSSPWWNGRKRPLSCFSPDNYKLRIIFVVSNGQILKYNYWLSLHKALGCCRRPSVLHCQLSRRLPSLLCSLKRFNIYFSSWFSLLSLLIALSLILILPFRVLIIWFDSYSNDWEFSLSFRALSFHHRGSFIIVLEASHQLLVFSIKFLVFFFPNHYLVV